MTINEVLNKKGGKVVTLRENDTLQDAVDAMVVNKIGAVMVTDDAEMPAGIFTERDLLRVSAETKLKLGSIRLKDEMTRDLVIGIPSDEIESILSVMTEKRLRHIPVMENQKLVGIISAGDLVRALLQDHKFEIHYLKDYITGKY